MRLYVVTLRSGDSGWTYMAKADKPRSHFARLQEASPFELELTHVDEGGAQAADVAERLGAAPVPGRPRWHAGAWPREEVERACRESRAPRVTRSQRRRAEQDFRGALRMVDVDLYEGAIPADDRRVLDLVERVEEWERRAVNPHEAEWAARMRRELQLVMAKHEGGGR